jgi:3-(methylthio)propanoyl-CoA dehydrogenase
MTYVAPLADQKFALETIANIHGIAALSAFQDVSPDLVDAILTEAGKFSAGVFAPLNRIGDTQGATWTDGVVTLPAGYKDAYKQYVEGGWGSIGCDPAHGGQGMPFALATAVMEQSVCMAALNSSVCILASWYRANGPAR